MPLLETALAITLIVLSGAGFAAKGGDPGPPTGGEASNMLSVPGIQTESATSSAAFWSPPGSAVLGTHYSYGCDKPEASGQFNYPNTSCVDNLDKPAVYFDPAACTASGAPCEGYEVSRIYWQKVDVNEWSADDDGLLDKDPNFAYVYFTDWGDALEAVSWTERSVIRVETQPYSNTIPDYVPEAGCTDDTLCKTGFQMWHVSGQGITEHWGARATDAAVSYNYDSPFQIIKTTKARLNLTKLVPETAVCPQPGGNANEGPPELNFEWTGSSWIVRNGDGSASDTCEVYDELYSVETSVGGKYVYGYNLRMKDVDIVLSCPGWLKTGYWRLTFYVPRDVQTGEWQDVLFHDASIPNVAPPAPATCARTFPISEDCIPAPEPEPVAAVESEDEDPDADDRLFKPEFSDTTEYNLSYLDICIVAKSQGGGNGGGKGGGMGGGRGSGKGGGKGGGDPGGGGPGGGGPGGGGPGGGGPGGGKKP
jgi:hypothetical protein